MKTYHSAAAAALLSGAWILATQGVSRADDSAGALAGTILERTSMNRGLVTIVGGDGGLAIALATRSELLVHVREPDSAVVAGIRRKADEAGFPIQRVVVEQGSLDSLPFADNTVDLVVTRRASPEWLAAMPAREILRALRPGGVAMIGSARTEDAGTLAGWTAAAAGVSTDSWTDDHGSWLRLTKPAMEGTDDWSHWEKSPDNNPVSNDAVIKAPYMTQFMAKPYYIGMPAVTTVAGGRTFLAMGHIAHHKREWDMLNRLIARNGYNGTILWDRKLPEDYLVHRSAFVATEDIFYMIDGDRALMLDARTGEERGEVRIPGVKGDWKWMAISDGILYALAGKPGPGAELVKGNRALGGWSWADLSTGYYAKRVPHGFGDTLAAYDLESGALRWLHREETLMDGRGLAIRDGRFYLYCPDRHLRALDLVSGKEVWTNSAKQTLELIEESGKGLVSTPGWRTQSLIVATPKALVIQGQTRMNVVGVSADDGKLLWRREKITNNPNAIFVDDQVVVGIGPGGKHVAIDPLTGDNVEYLGFTKRACTRLTASPDSFFTRGEGMLRFDRDSRQVMVDGAVRPACNDGVIPANGLLYLGPWACDCNLSLIGNVARCSAGEFVFDHVAGAGRLETAGEAAPPVFEVTPGDWHTFRGNLKRSGSTPARVRPIQRELWRHEPERAHVPTEATSAGGMIFLGGDDGKVRALDAATGRQRWQIRTGGVVKYPPTIAHDRAYFGSGDGWAYCAAAATGDLLWRFRAAPVERSIMVYDSLSSTWPVNTGVLVHDRTAYFAAGIVDHDGTYVYALDALTGAVKWQNNSSGHLNMELRKGVSAQGNLTIMGNRLLLAGGNVVSPASFDLETGRSLDEPRPQGQPQNNGGKFVGVFGERHAIAGGRILHSSPRNVSTKGSFDLWTPGQRPRTLNYGGIPPAWDDDTLVVANFKYGRITTLDNGRVLGRLRDGERDQDAPRNRFANNLASSMTTRDETRWVSDLGDSNSFEPVSLAVAPNAVMAVAKYTDFNRARPLWSVLGLAPESGKLLFRSELPGEPLPGGLLVDRDGRTVVVLLDGRVVCYGAQAEARNP